MYRSPPSEPPRPVYTVHWPEQTTGPTTRTGQYSSRGWSEEPSARVGAGSTCRARLGRGRPRPRRRAPPHRAPRGPVPVSGSCIRSPFAQSSVGLCSKRRTRRIPLSLPRKRDVDPLDARRRETCDASEMPYLGRSRVVDPSSAPSLTCPCSAGTPAPGLRVSDRRVGCR